MGRRSLADMAVNGRDDVASLIICEVVAGFHALRQPTRDPFEFCKLVGDALHYGYSRTSKTTAEDQTISARAYSPAELLPRNAITARFAPCSDRPGADTRGYVAQRRRRDRGARRRRRPRRSGMMKRRRYRMTRKADAT